MEYVKTDAKGKPENTYCIETSSGHFAGGDKKYFNYLKGIKTMSEGDFGFTATDGDDAVLRNTRQHAILEIQQFINPFLTKLQADPTKAMLKWPARAAEVAEFQKKFNEICEAAKAY